MSVHPPQASRQARSVREDWGHTTDPQEEQAAGGCTRYIVLLLVLLVVVVLCALGFLLARALFSGSPTTAPPALAADTSSPFPTGPGTEVTVGTVTPGQGQISLDPARGYVNTLIAVTGQGWWPGEPVFVFLRAPSEGESPAYAYAAAVVDDSASFHTALTFPNELRWIGEEWAEVIARGTRSGLEASARFTLVAPTPTATLPPPTPAPTRPSTNTPWPSDTPLPTPTPLPTLTPTPDLIITDWRGEYFANRTLAGSPALIRNDKAIDFNWGAGSPGQGIPEDQFSARWTRQLSFSEGSYRFTITADDGVRFWIDGQIVVDEWRDGMLTDHSFDTHLSKGQRALHLEYYENLGGAMIRLTWARIEPSTPTPPPPTDTPSPTPGPTDTPSPPSRPLPDLWQAEYYANPVFLGQPALVRSEGEISFDWGLGSPGEGIPVDNFSARWTGQQWMTAGTYRYFLMADDGARLYIDGQMVINAWQVLPGQDFMKQVHLAEGVHTFQVEYFEAVSDAYIHLRAEAAPGQIPLPLPPGF